MVGAEPNTKTERCQDGAVSFFTDEQQVAEEAADAFMDL